MAQRAIIGINGDLIGFDEQLDKIRTPGIGTSSVTWVPDADTRCTTLHVTANGTYNAAQRGDYGYDYVTVSVPGSSVTGRDPDTGEEVVVSTDPDTGEIIETVVPVEIRVIEPPTNPYGIYVDGQTIGKDGMVVKAYSANGDEMQVVPNGEITLNPTQAVYDSSQDVGRHGTATVEDTSGLSADTIAALPIPYGSQVIGSSQNYETGMPGGMGDAITQLSSSSPVYSFAYKNDTDNVGVFMCSLQPFSGVATTHNPGGTQGYNRPFSSNPATINNKTVYVDQVLGSDKWSLSTPPITSADIPKEIAYVILYGDRDETPAGSPQTITVSWPRPGDGAILETTFDILVGPHGGEED